jgi:hypothetical protein
MLLLPCKLCDAVMVLCDAVIVRVIRERVCTEVGPKRVGGLRRGGRVQQVPTLCSCGRLCAAVIVLVVCGVEVMWVAIAVLCDAVAILCGA